MGILSYVLAFGVPTGFFIWLLVDILVIHQHRGEKLASWISKLFSWTGKTFQKAATANSIQEKINSFVGSIDSQVRGLMPFGIKIKWVSPEIDKEAFIENNRVVVLLSRHQNQDENLSRATALYMNKAVIPEARPHIDARLCKAIDLMMTKKALYSFIEARSVLDYYITNILRPEIEADNDIKEFCESIEVTDEKGLFTRILLRELLELGRMRAGHSQSGNSVFEASNFVKHLKKIAEKESGKDINPNFISNDIRMSVIFIARSEKIAIGSDQYTKAIEKYALQNNAKVIYVLARGVGINFAKEVVQKAIGMFPSLYLAHEEDFSTRMTDNKIVKTYCGILYNRKEV